jgi:hypothetical protein
VEHCHNCGQELVKIDHRGHNLQLWTAGDGKEWTKLSVEDLRALH